MLGNDYEEDVSDMMGRMEAERGMSLYEEWNKTNPVLKQAMALVA